MVVALLLHNYTVSQKIGHNSIPTKPQENGPFIYFLAERIIIQLFIEESDAS